MTVEEFLKQDPQAYIWANGQRLYWSEADGYWDIRDSAGRRIYELEDLKEALEWLGKE